MSFPTDKAIPFVSLFIFIMQFIEFSIMFIFFSYLNCLSVINFEFALRFNLLKLLNLLHQLIHHNLNRQFSYRLFQQLV